MTKRTWAAVTLLAIVLVSLVVLLISRAPTVAVGRTISSTAAKLAKEEQASTNSALEFARLYSPDELVRPYVTSTFRAAYERSFDSDPHSVAVERRYPGTRNVTVKAAVEKTIVLYLEHLPIARNKLTEIVAEYFTEQQLGQVKIFFRSEAGQKMQWHKPLSAKDQEAVSDFQKTAGGRRFYALAAKLSDFNRRENEDFQRKIQNEVASASSAAASSYVKQLRRGEKT